MLVESQCKFSHSCAIQYSPAEACMAQYSVVQSYLDTHSPL